MTIEEIRDELIRWKDQHKATCTNQNCAEPLNALAFLAHCAGLKVAHIGYFEWFLHDYEVNCAGFPHHRN